MTRLRRMIRAGAAIDPAAPIISSCPAPAGVISSWLNPHDTETPHAAPPSPGPDRSAGGPRPAAHAHAQPGRGARLLPRAPRADPAHPTRRGRSAGAAPSGAGRRHRGARLPAPGCPAADGAAGTGVLPRRRLGDRRSGHPRHPVPRTGQRERLRRGVGRLPAGARAPLSGRLRRRAGRHALGFQPRGRARGRPHPPGRRWRQRRRQPGRRGGAGGARPGRWARPAADRLSAADLPRHRHAPRPRLAPQQRRGLRADARNHGLLHRPLPARRHAGDGLARLAAAGLQPYRPAAGAGADGRLRPAGGRRPGLRPCPDRGRQPRQLRVL